MIQKAKNRNLIGYEKQNSDKNNRIKTNINNKNLNNAPDGTQSVEVKVPPKKSFDINISKLQFLSNHLPSKYLSNLILNDYYEYFAYLKIIENLNLVLSEYLIKKKINIREIEVRIKIEDERKQKESLMIKKNLEEKVESVLEKANSCLENIKNLSKKENSVSNTNLKIMSVTKEKSKISKNIQIKSTNLDPLQVVISNLSNKYNSEILINEENLNFYFSLVARNRKSIKDLKDKYKRFSNKNKSAKDVFNKIYIVNKRNHPTNSEKKENFDKSNFSFSSMIYKQLDMILHPLNLLQSDLFEKLFMKILYLKNSYKESDIYDIFSFWYYLKNIKGKLVDIENIKLDKETSINISSQIIKVEKYSYSSNCNKEKKFINFTFFENLALKNLSRYFQSLFKTKSNQENKTINNINCEIKEEEIFDNKFYSLYDSIIKMNRIKYIKMILHLIQEKHVNNDFLSNIPKNVNLIPKEQLEECLFLKSIYALIANNGSFSYQISKIN